MGQGTQKEHQGKKLMGAPKVFVLSDFDGTITTCNTMDILYETHASCGLKYVREWEAGNLSTMEEEKISFEHIKATPAEMERTIDENMVIDPAIGDLVAYCYAHDYGFAIVSEGQTWYIHYMLGKLGLNVDKVYGSELTFNADGSFSMAYPYHDPRYPMRGTAKASIIENYKKEGYFTIFLGDGKSDTDAVKAADKVYAKDHLLEYCLKHDIAVTGFDDLKGLLELWEQQPPAL